ncbi:MAG TPA: type II toxin-antitoxin system ParD family antitoxin [Terracidiphilus sp.]|nr:type II toxin-antitoxin system ParD family antitoxin [Terracidiphilus sp.]
MTTLTISLPDSLREFIDREVEAKGYGNVSEYVRGLLREAQARDADARLETLLLEGLAQGDAERLSAAFWTELRAEAVKAVKTRTLRRKARN